MTPSGAPPPDRAAADLLPEGWLVDTMGEGDLDEVLAVEAASFTNPWSRQMFVWELQNAGVSYAFVLRTPEWRVAAFCTIWVVLDEIHINNVAVRPECRGQGVGRKLLLFVLGQGGRLGARRATLEVRRSNAAALKLYERLGFRLDGVRRNYYSSPVEDALVLWLDRLPGADWPDGRGAA